MNKAGKVTVVSKEEWRFAACDGCKQREEQVERDLPSYGGSSGRRKWTNGKHTLCDSCAEDAGWIYEPENAPNTYEVRE